MRTTARVRVRHCRMAAARRLPRRLRALVTRTTTTATTTASGSAIAFASGSAPRRRPGTADATTTSMRRPTGALPPGAIATMARGRLRRAPTPAVHSLLLTSARATLLRDEGILELVQQMRNLSKITILVRTVHYVRSITLRVSKYNSSISDEQTRAYSYQSYKQVQRAYEYDESQGLNAATTYR